MKINSVAFIIVAITYCDGTLYISSKNVTWFLDVALLGRETEQFDEEVRIHY